MVPRTAVGMYAKHGGTSYQTNSGTENAGGNHFGVCWKKKKNRWKCRNRSDDCCCFYSILSVLCTRKLPELQGYYIRGVVRADM